MVGATESRLNGPVIKQQSANSGSSLTKNLTVADFFVEKDREFNIDWYQKATIKMENNFK